MIDWGNLPFSYKKTTANIRCNYTNGTWGNVEVSESENINIHMSATCLNYGQECFEGLKAYRGKDGKIRLFRWQENAKRLSKSAQKIGMPEIPETVFKECLFELLKHNEDFVPPHGTGATLYIRPLVLGTSAQLGVSPAKDYLLILYCSPVGPYFKGGFKPVKVAIERMSDRAAPLGTGDVKVGGNYAASLNTTMRIHEQGYSSALYLDPKEKKYIDECGPANFLAIKDNTYVTPKSTSILTSITNASLQELAIYLGMKVEKRQIPYQELSTFEEVAQCGTAAVLTPIHTIVDPDENIEYTFGTPDTAGKHCTKLYETLVGIQFGDIEDPFGWVTVL
jgi:branched-chain amino acid aminotransferase